MPADLDGQLGDGQDLGNDQEETALAQAPHFEAAPTQARRDDPGSRDAGLSGAGLNPAGLNPADLSGAGLSGARLKRARLKRTGRNGARHVSPIRVIRRPWTAAAAIAGILVICLGAAGLSWASHTGRPATRVGRPPVTPIPAGHWAAVPPAQAAAVPRPTGLVIPAIGVRTKLIRLGVTASGQLQVPASTSVAGWYTGSPRPGGTGSAVIAGHIDSVSGPGVFFRLRELRPGDLVYVQRGHAGMAVFKVTAVQKYLKSKFPTAAVYGPVPNAQLRLITCGGTFDPASGHYLSNVVVFAVLL